MAEGEEPLTALENLQSNLKPDVATLKLLRRDPVETMFLELTSHPETGKQYESLYQKNLKTTEHGEKFQLLIPTI
ncbi:MAG: hypothetical protein Ct9H300mP23_12130 [Nitrospinota bacterium]|nr:MAG: hypothetical protein Ct9H300mP23_12130 [Nitrospinota bacterium]